MSFLSLWKKTKTKVESVAENAVGDEVFLLVGLGNPGQKYTGTRHNLGRAVVEDLAESNDLAFSHDKRSNALVARGAVAGLEVECLLPETFMNRSGDSVREYLNYHQKNYRVVLLHDELDLLLGKIKISTSENAGGHNGVASVLKSVKKEVVRVRLGISPADDGPEYLNKMRQYRPQDFVLAPFDQEENVAEVVGKGVKAVKCLLKDGVDKAMNEVNGL